LFRSTKAESISVLTDRDALKHAIAPPKTSLTTGNHHDEADQAASAATGGRPHLPIADVSRHSMPRQKIDACSETSMGILPT